MGPSSEVQDYKVIFPNRSNDSEYPTGGQEILIEGDKEYGALRYDSKGSGFSFREFPQGRGEVLNTINYSLNVNSGNYQDEAFLFWVPTREEWMAATFDEYPEGYEQGRFLIFSNYGGPYGLNDSACEKLGRVYGVPSAYGLEKLVSKSPEDIEGLSKEFQGCKFSVLYDSPLNEGDDYAVDWSSNKWSISVKEYGSGWEFSDRFDKYAWGALLDAFDIPVENFSEDEISGMSPRKLSEVGRKNPKSDTLGDIRLASEVRN